MVGSEEGHVVAVAVVVPSGRRRWRSGVAVVPSVVMAGPVRWLMTGLMAGPVAGSVIGASGRSVGPVLRLVSGPLVRAVIRSVGPVGSVGPVVGPAFGLFVSLAGSPVAVAIVLTLASATAVVAVLFAAASIVIRRSVCSRFCCRSCCDGKSC